MPHIQHEQNLNTKTIKHETTNRTNMKQYLVRKTLTYDTIKIQNAKTIQNDN